MVFLRSLALFPGLADALKLLNGQLANLSSDAVELNLIFDTVVGTILQTLEIIGIAIASPKLKKGKIVGTWMIVISILTAKGSQVPESELKKNRAWSPRHGPISFGKLHRLEVSLAFRICSSCLVCLQIVPNKWALTCRRPKLIRGSNRGSKSPISAKVLTGGIMLLLLSPASLKPSKSTKRSAKLKMFRFSPSKISSMLTSLT